MLCVSTPPPPRAAWNRLAELLVARRLQLGFAYRNEFAAHVGMKSDKLLDDLENVRRTNFKPKTLAKIDKYYQWAPGSCETVLDGGDPSTLEPRFGTPRYLNDFSNEELLLELGRRIALRDERLQHLINEDTIADALHASRELTTKDDQL